MVGQSTKVMSLKQITAISGISSKIGLFLAAFELRMVPDHPQHVVWIVDPSYMLTEQVGPGHLPDTTYRLHRWGLVNWFPFLESPLEVDMWCPQKCRVCFELTVRSLLPGVLPSWLLAALVISHLLFELSYLVAAALADAGGVWCICCSLWLVLSQILCPWPACAPADFEACCCSWSGELVQLPSSSEKLWQR